jgi:hypothetical protein
MTVVVAVVWILMLLFFFFYIGIVFRSYRFYDADIVSLVFARFNLRCVIILDFSLLPMSSSLSALLMLLVLYSLMLLLSIVLELVDAQSV